MFAFIALIDVNAVERTKLNFNGGWLLKVGDFKGANWEGYTYACLGYVHIQIDKPVLRIVEIDFLKNK